MKRLKRVLATILLCLPAVPAIAQQNEYLGKLSANRYDAESVANAYGSYGSPYSPNSVNNQFGAYGSLQPAECDESLHGERAAAVRFRWHLPGTALGEPVRSGINVEPVRRLRQPVFADVD
jgi:hypothetical protein